MSVSRGLKMKTEESTALAIRQTGALAIIGTQLRLKKKILDAHRLATLVDEFHVPQDGSLFDAVERVRPGGIIQIATGEFRIDKAIHITKPLSIVGEGKEHTFLVSNLSEYCLNVLHDGYFEFKKISIRSDDALHGGMIAVNCGELLIEQNVFFGTYDNETLFEENENRNPVESCALSIDGKTLGNIRGNSFIQNIDGLNLKGASWANITDNFFANNKRHGIGYMGSATGIAAGNTCRGNTFDGIRVTDEAYPKLLKNMCENNESAGISYVGSAAGIAEGNICRGNNNSGILLCEESSPKLLGNICEDNRVIGIGYMGNSSGSAESNTCTGNIHVGIAVKDKSSPDLMRNVCDENEQAGITFLGSASGTAQGNYCRGNNMLGILVGDNASPTLKSNICENSAQFGIVYTGSATGIAERNCCRKNMLGGVIVLQEANPKLINNLEH